MRAPLATFGPTMNGWRGCCGAPTVVSVATTPSTSAAMWAALKRRVEVTRDVRLVDCMTLHLPGPLQWPSKAEFASAAGLAVRQSMNHRTSGTIGQSGCDTLFLVCMCWSYAEELP